MSVVSDGELEGGASPGGVVVLDTWGAVDDERWRSVQVMVVRVSLCQPGWCGAAQVNRG